MRTRGWFLKPPLRDEQETPPSGYCRVCGGELYGEELDLYDGICEECWEVKEEEQND